MCSMQWLKAPWAHVSQSHSSRLMDKWITSFGHAVCSAAVLLQRLSVRIFTLVQPDCSANQQVQYWSMNPLPKIFSLPKPVQPSWRPLPPFHFHSTTAYQGLQGQMCLISAGKPWSLLLCCSKEQLIPVQSDSTINRVLINWINHNSIMGKMAEGATEELMCSRQTQRSIIFMKHNHTSCDGEHAHWQTLAICCGQQVQTYSRSDRARQELNAYGWFANQTHHEKHTHTDAQMVLRYIQSKCVWRMSTTICLAQGLAAPCYQSCQAGRSAALQDVVWVQRRHAVRRRVNIKGGVCVYSKATVNKERGWGTRTQRLYSSRVRQQFPKWTMHLSSTT